MNRREALSSVALLLGGTIIGADVFLSGCKTTTKKEKEGLFSKGDVAFLDEVGDTILPATASSPGAKEAKIGQFMKTIVTDCYNENDQNIFTSGIKKLNQASKKKFDQDFVNLTAGQKHELLVSLDKEAKDYQDAISKRNSALTAAQKQERKLKANKDADDSPHYFTMMKQLTLWGYFTSEPGATKALRYVAVPGRYQGCIPYKKGDKAWAT
ncbi:MAG TPA: gluconate 2-dehydrogenase subunit 3 family protein [Chitinophagaceae bacterium]